MQYLTMYDSTRLQLGQFFKILWWADVWPRRQPLPDLDKGWAQSSENPPEFHRPLTLPLIEQSLLVIHKQLQREAPQSSENLKRPQRHLNQ